METDTVLDLEPVRVANADRHILEVTIARPGPTKHRPPYVLTRQVLEPTAPLWTGAAMFLGHDWIQGMGKPHDLVGVYLSAEWAPEADALRALVRITDDTAFALAQQIIADREAGLPVPDVGISGVFDWTTKTQPDGSKLVTEIAAVHSADIVFKPAAGGALERVLLSAGIQPKDPAPATAPTDLLAAQAAVEALTAERDAGAARTAALAEQLAGVTSRYADVLRSANPAVPPGLISGDTPEALDASLVAARATVEDVLARNPQPSPPPGTQPPALPATAPAGAPPRGTPDYSALNPRDKIITALAG